MGGGCGGEAAEQGGTQAPASGGGGARSNSGAVGGNGSESSAGSSGAAMSTAGASASGAASAGGGSTGGAGNMGGAGGAGGSAGTAGSSLAGSAGAGNGGSTGTAGSGGQRTCRRASKPMASGDPRDPCGCPCCWSQDCLNTDTACCGGFCEGADRRARLLRAMSPNVRHEWVRALACRVWSYRLRSELESAARFRALAPALRACGASSIIADMADNAAADELRHADLCRQLDPPLWRRLAGRAGDFTQHPFAARHPTRGAGAVRARRAVLRHRNAQHGAVGRARRTRAGPGLSTSHAHDPARRGRP